ncbi:hypothetical protein Poli38472_001671 [Pythium oligandrum]|uniref:FYVE-type domain-containing protein n=1 Tax=Pythium oligandrum TaxID=41045 RepID=A0A8K1CVM5_PYTOL|nr:hypothetical protein Poli38472_001671 [Pythium oligandrum]|eukprot:TMW69515.1 hypothetical protein Poli38472_001671 [Pythium oligandrum]
MTMAARGKVPPPLTLPGNTGDFELDGSSPRIPAPLGSGTHGRSKGCQICERSFTVFRAKHTCKVCGRKICDDCSKNRVKLNRRLERRKGSRLCDPCARSYMQSPTSPNTPPINDGAKESESSPDQTPTASEHEEVVPVLRKVASLALLPLSSRRSNLRTRHWLAIMGLAGLLFFRTLRFLASRQIAGVEVENRGFQIRFLQFFLSTSAWMESIASLRFLGFLLCGLIVYDEVMAFRQRGFAHRDAYVANASGVALPTRPRLRSRTRSGMASAPVVPVRPREDEEVVEVEVDDKGEDATGFNVDKLTVILTESTSKNRAPDGQLKVACFLVACEQICGLIHVFGRATSFAASTVTGYISTIGTNLAGWPTPASGVYGTAPTAVGVFSWKEQSVRAIILREVELQVAAAGGKKKPSCARCVLRLLWFIEFVDACLRYTLIENRDESCVAGASKAYEETIGARHPWIIRKGVNSALASLPTRSTILESMNLSNHPAPEEVLKNAQALIRNMIDELNALMKEHNLQDIK